MTVQADTNPNEGAKSPFDGLFGRIYDILDFDGLNSKTRPGNTHWEFYGEGKIRDLSIQGAGYKVMWDGTWKPISDHRIRVYTNFNGIIYDLVFVQLNENWTYGNNINSFYVVEPDEKKSGRNLVHFGFHNKLT